MVNILNKFPDVYTFSSCGGHSHPENGQSPHNEWTINFSTEGESPAPSIKGWGSIGKIAQTAVAYLSTGCGGEIILHVWNNSDGREDDTEGLCNDFELHGYDTDIGVFCDILEQHLPNKV